MFSNWLTRKSLLTKKKNQNVMRVQNMLLEAPKGIDKFYSPTLCQLQINKEHRVKKLSSIYEENLTNDTTGLSTIHEHTPLSSRKIIVPPSQNFDDQTSQIKKIYEVILEKDIEYTNHMQKMIDSYISELDFEVRFVGEKEREELIFSVFGNIKSIHEMHKEKFQPFIKSFLDDLQQSNAPVSSHVYDFARKLIVLCRNGEFYPYLLHSMYEKESTTKREKFYSHLMVYAAQKYQFEYSFDPFYQLMYYGSLFEEILNEVVKEAKASMKCILHFRDALKEFSDLLVKIKGAAI